MSIVLLFIVQVSAGQERNLKRSITLSKENQPTASTHVIKIANCGIHFASVEKIPMKFIALVSDVSVFW
jgi:hypothetical protein